MKKIILTILFLFCFFDASFPGSEHLLCPVPEPPATCDKVYHSSSCNAVLCPDNTPFGMATVVEPVCNSSQYVSTRAPTSGTVTCTLECDVSCIYKCPQGMYGYVAVKDVGDAIYPQISECYACPGGETVVSCGLIEDKELSGQIDELGNLIQYASKLVCQTGYHESGHDCVPDCPENSHCPDGVFVKCNDGYYGNASDGCKACPSDAICSDTAITGCRNDGYILESDACTKCLVGEDCTNGAFKGCAEGYYGSGKGNCKVCPTNGDCTGGIFNGCKSGYYGNLNAGCRACPANATCDGGATFKCNANYFKYTNETETGCTKCPTLDGRPGTSVAGANTDRSSCSVSVTSSSTLNDGVGTYYFEEGTCYASK